MNCAKLKFFQHRRITTSTLTGNCDGKRKIYVKTKKKDKNIIKITLGSGLLIYLSLKNSFYGSFNLGTLLFWRDLFIFSLWIIFLEVTIPKKRCEICKEILSRLRFRYKLQVVYTFNIYDKD